MKVINRKNITISQDFSTFVATPRVFSFALNMNFQPDEMIVKCITTNGHSGAITNNNFLLYSSTLNEVLGRFNYFTVFNHDLHFNVKNLPINTQLGFQVKLINGAIDTAYLGQITIHLEFVKYE